MLDFIADVHLAAKRTLTEPEFAYYTMLMKQNPLNTSIQTEPFMALFEKLGRVFEARGLYPIKGYFSAPLKPQESRCQTTSRR